MARSVSEIKQIMTDSFMANETVINAYNLQQGDTFESRFSRVSIESILFYVVAFCVWTLETLFDTYRDEVSARIENIIPHRTRWYAYKALNFMKDMVLAEDSDEYDTTGMDDGTIAAAKVIKHAVAIESDDASILMLKIAGESGDVRNPVDADTEAQFAAYIAEIKDAGVRISIVNAAADVFSCELDIYYNPMLLPGDVETACREAIKNYIENLPFNGEYSNMRLVDTLQAVAGVKIVEFKSATCTNENITVPELINAKAVPYAGYFKANDITLNMMVYDL
jgi:hypothetical protein